MFAEVGSMVAGLMFIWAVFQQCCPNELRHHMENYYHRIFTFVHPYIQITVNEFLGERFRSIEAFSSIENYLSSIASRQAKRLKVTDEVKTTQSLVLSMDDSEEVADKFEDVEVWWASGKYIVNNQSFSEKRYYKLTFHKRSRDLILGSYLNHVLKEGNAVKVRNRQRKLYTNSGSYWSNVVFEHPATFKTLAIEAEKKKEIEDDLVTFSEAEEFYARIGRAWKRGYLLYGPPGTGKSTMIAAMANLLNYDIYDLELTAVKDNVELRRLLFETSSKSILVIEDIDCSLDLTGQRRKKKQKEGEPEAQKDDDGSSQVTLSGLLNFVDGIWSACRGERLIVFTTNFVDKLDPALIRKGRMDKHIPLSYCGFEAFKVLAKNYLKLESHELFTSIGNLLGEVQITPADVTEHLMPKTIPVDAEACLKSLIQALDMKKKQRQVEKEPPNKEEAKEN
uniref:Uncharacterized protein MANES_15G175500 n=1 Tax=Rhizophora mucronata TaxID=61149 RepID=A0A2P2Q3F1_RHIMU